MLDEGIDVNSIDLDGRTGLHIAACEGHVEVVKLLLQRKANIDARDRWGSTVRYIISLLVNSGNVAGTVEPIASKNNFSKN